MRSRAVFGGEAGERRLSCESSGEWPSLHSEVVVTATLKAHSYGRAWALSLFHHSALVARYPAEGRKGRFGKGRPRLFSTTLQTPERGSAAALLCEISHCPAERRGCRLQSHWHSSPSHRFPPALRAAGSGREERGEDVLPLTLHLCSLPRALPHNAPVYPPRAVTSR
ncbi:hypothetical protein SKAU_G00272530 [Synaphobranchus kaupii]|uniref:Uncharacterized protein n=1 Tax=Synaphobranchus kaupii TaxID=118154 RepID=A0A9Q1F0W8_SYNKA|nr:hypothetical protein SKAU_G00272530 [Synaphobranchus kaupii]